MASLQFPCGLAILEPFLNWFWPATLTFDNNDNTKKIAMKMILHNTVKCFKYFSSSALVAEVLHQQLIKVKKL